MFLQFQGELLAPPCPCPRPLSSSSGGGGGDGIPAAARGVPYTPRPVYGGAGLLGRTVPAELRRGALVYTQPEPWALAAVRDAFEFDDDLDCGGLGGAQAAAAAAAAAVAAAAAAAGTAAAVVTLVTDVEYENLKAMAAAAAVALAEGKGQGKGHAPRAVFGIGGGTALDTAKFISAALALPLVLMPTLLSVAAGYTVAAGVREVRSCSGGTGGDGDGSSKAVSVAYVGDARPAHLLVDFDVLRAAPAALNLSGVGDLLSCYTALWDWEQAHARQGERFDGAAAARTRALLETLLSDDAADALREQTDDGLRLQSELFVEEVAICEAWGNARPEEGSEHYIGYALEQLTGAHYLHGRLIALCVVLTAAYQGQDTARIVAWLGRLGMDWSFAAVGTTRAEMRQVLLGIGDFVAKERQLLPGVFHFFGGVPEDRVDALLDVAEAPFKSAAARLRAVARSLVECERH